jgi:hypothetical protein
MLIILYSGDRDQRSEGSQFKASPQQTVARPYLEKEKTHLKKELVEWLKV